MSDDDTRHSGSRWEPTPPSVPEKDVPANGKPAVDGTGTGTGSTGTGTGTTGTST